MADYITADPYALDHAAMLAFNLQPPGPAVPVYRLDLPELEAEAYRTGNALALSVLAACSEALEYMHVIRQLEEWRSWNRSTRKATQHG